MALGQENPRDMPRLLEPGWVPTSSQARRFWEYLHRWRVSLFRHCIREGCGDTQPADLARLVDHLIGTRLLLFYVGRWTEAGVREQYRVIEADATDLTQLAIHGEVD